MAVIAICPRCQSRLKAPEELIGKTVKCPGCTTPVTIRAAANTPLPATKPAISAVRTSPPPAPPRPKPVLDQLPEVEEDEEVADVIPAEDEIVEVDEIEEVEDIEEVEEIEEIEEVDDRRITTSLRSSRRRRDDDYDDEEDEDRPRRSKKRNSERDRDRRDNEKMLAMLLHLSSFLAGFIAPLIIWLVKKDESRFIDHHGRTHLNFVVTMFVWTMGICVVGFSVGCLLGMLVPVLAAILFIITWLALAGMGIYQMVIIIIAAVNAKNGVWYELPNTIAPFGRVRNSALRY